MDLLTEFKEVAELPIPPVQILNHRFKAKNL